MAWDAFWDRLEHLPLAFSWISAQNDGPNSDEKQTLPSLCFSILTESSPVGRSIKIRLEKRRINAGSKSHGQFEHAITNGSGLLSTRNPSNCWSNSDLIRRVVSSSWLVRCRVMESISSMKIMAGRAVVEFRRASQNSSRIFRSDSPR